jgi:hypothetical protein
VLGAINADAEGHHAVVLAEVHPSIISLTKSSSDRSAASGWAKRSLGRGDNRRETAEQELLDPVCSVR